ncbi:MAG: hypothetical protein KGH76_06230 [Thaumarchaeota archaeon]|nr:hypothetical protein [Nitrososphaerota archaeon]
MKRLALGALISLGVMMILSGNSYATNQDKTVCVYEPMDLFMDGSLPTVISDEVNQHGINVKQVRIVDQILGKTTDCSYVIKIDRAINQNYAYTDHTVKYMISGNVATVFTYKTAAVFSPSSGGGNGNAPAGDNGHPASTGGSNFKPMTNWGCELMAQATAHYDDYHVGSIVSTQYCDPYMGENTSHRMGELPYNVIRNSVDLALKSLGV